MAKRTANGVELEVEERGSHEAPALLLLRGLGTQLVQWPEVLLETLAAAGLRVIVFDNRDAGLSEKMAAPYRLEDMADDTLGLLDGLGIPFAHLAGISMGGMIVQLAAARAPKRVASLASIMSSSGAPGLPPPTKAALDALLSRPQDPTDRECVIRHAMHTQRVFQSPAYPMRDDELRRYVERAYDRCHCPEGVARQLAAIQASGSRAELLATLRIPTLVIHGADDPLVPVAAGQDTARRIPSAHLEVIPGMGHDVTEANAPLLARLLIAHIRAAGDDGQAAQGKGPLKSGGP